MFDVRFGIRVVMNSRQDKGVILSFELYRVESHFSNAMLSTEFKCLLGGICLSPSVFSLFMMRSTHPSSFNWAVLSKGMRGAARSSVWHDWHKVSTASGFLAGSSGAQASSRDSCERSETGFWR